MGSVNDHLAGLVPDGGSLNDRLAALPAGLAGTYGTATSVKAHGALGNGIRVADAAIASGTDDLTSASNPFMAWDVGKTIIVDGAGADGAALTTTISAYVSAGAVTLAVSATTTVAAAVATFGTDDTAAIEAAVTAAMGDQVAPAGAILFPASDWYIYNGAGIDPGQRLAVLGIDRQVSRIVVGTGKYLIDTSGYCDKLTLANLTVWGGKGAYRSTFTGAEPSGSKHITGCDLLAYTECAISTDSSDSPWWHIKDNQISGANSETTIGVALGDDASGSSIRSCFFGINRVGVKLRSGTSVTIDGNDFVAHDAGDVGSPRAKVWVVPHTSPTNGGNGCRISNNKFGNENLLDWDDHILYADEDAIGTTNATKMPVRGTASTGYVVGQSIEGNRFSGAGASGRADVFSTAPNVTIAFGANEHDGTAPSYLIEFLAAVTVGAGSLVTVADMLVTTPTSNKAIAARTPFPSDIFLSAPELSPTAGSAAHSAWSTVPVLLLDDSFDEAVGGIVPASRFKGWSTFDVVALVGNATADTGNFALIAARNNTTLGTSAVAATFGSLVVTAALGQYLTQEVTVFSGLTAPVSGVFQITVYRDANDVADTKVGDIGLLGVYLRQVT